MDQEKIEGLFELFPYDKSIISKEMIDDRMEILPLMNSQVLATMDYSKYGIRSLYYSTYSCFLGDE